MRMLVFALSIATFFACNSSPEDTSTISVPKTVTHSPPVIGTAEAPEIRLEIAGVPPAGALLIGQFMEQQFRADSAKVSGTAAVFARAEPYPAGYYFVYFKDGSSVPFLLDEDQTFTLQSQQGDLVASMQVSGSETNRLLYAAMQLEAGQAAEFRRIAGQLQQAPRGSDTYEALQAERRALVEVRREQLAALFAQAPNSLFTAFKRAGQNPPLREIRLPDGSMDEAAQVAAFRNEFWDGVNFKDDRLLRTPVIFNKLKRYLTELTPQNATAIKESADKLLTQVLDSPEYYKFFANWITLQYEPGKSTVMDAEAIHVHMIQQYFTRARAFWADSMTVYGLQDRASQMANSLVGQQGPDITVPGLNGQPQRLYDLDKPYIAVFMYNPECDHCIEQTPKLKAAYQQLRQEVAVYAIALDTEAAKWKAFVQAYGLEEFTNVFDPSNRSIFKTYYVDNTPELYLLGPDRKIIAKNLKASQLVEAIRIAKSKEG